MSETPPETNGTPQGGEAPVMRLVQQYLKDLSFESPGAPQSIRNDLPAPQVEVSVDVNAHRLEDDQFEVELACSATASRDGKTVFLVECNYAGHFLIQNLPPQALEAALLVEGPRLLFPFARQVVAAASRDGGFMPLMLEPLDFAAMYRMQAAQRQKAAQDAGGEAGPAPTGQA